MRSKNANSASHPDLSKNVTSDPQARIQIGQLLDEISIAPSENATSDSQARIQIGQMFEEISIMPSKNATLDPYPDPSKNATADPQVRTKIGQLFEEISIALQGLVSQQAAKHELEKIAFDRRQVARVIDRLFFVIFLFASIVITLWFSVKFASKGENTLDA